VSASPNIGADLVEPVGVSMFTRRQLLTAGTFGICCAAVGSNQCSPARGGFTDSIAQRRDIHPDGLFTLRSSGVGLSFDDGPDPAFTPGVLDILREHGVPATFFLVGANASAYPDLVQRIQREGHTIANHTSTHADLQTVNNARVLEEFTTCYSAIGHEPGYRALLRPPFGHTSDAVKRAARQLDHRPTFWDVCIERFISSPTDVAGLGACITNVASGSLILGHDGGVIQGSNDEPIDRTATVEMLANVIRGVRSRGLDFDHITG
jgi:peptidoglycan/xylan/chitin deacetylase (PgdA/CDA1 family)